MSELLDNRTYYDEFSHVYDRERHDGYHALIDELETGIVLRYGRAKDVLEAGCGTGLILDRLRPFVSRAVGLDLSAGMLGHAARRGLAVVQGSIENLPFADGSFDLVCSFKVLAHVERIREAVSELARVTKPGGYLALEFYNPLSIRTLIKRLKPPTSVGQNAHDQAVYTRYDALATVQTYLPRDFPIIDLRGIRVVTPFSTVFKVPVLNRIFGAAERRLCDMPGVRRLGGFLVVVARKPPEAPRP